MVVYASNSSYYMGNIVGGLQSKADLGKKHETLSEN
jgi:hypothetical protein